MHEATVTAQLVDAVLEELKKYKVLSVSAVTLTVGELTNLGAEQMEFAYSVITRDTVLEGSKLIVETESVSLRCSKCGYEGPAKNLDFGDTMEHRIPILSCPVCGGPVMVTAGQSCCVKNMDIECEE
jgi:hydrogenase nickel incorporation protein HypA/HybF